MANSHEERNDQGFNNLRNSSMDKREKKGTLRAYTFLGIIILTAILIVTLLVTAIGAIIANVADKNGDDPNPAPTGSIKWTSITVTDADTKAGPLTLVNATHEYIFPETDDHLGLIYAAWAKHTPTVYKLGLSSHMEQTALAAMDSMLADFSAATGKTDVLVRYAYRSAEEQTALGSSTPAGFSDHHTGFGCDLKYLKDGKQYDLSADPTYAWISENCQKYGFVVRYPDAKQDITGVSDYESYFRYVGVAHATYMTANDLCMEEYLELLRTQKNPLKVTGADGNKYEIYYYAAAGDTEVDVPTNYAYTISGTNDGGVVVTVNRSKAPAPTETETATDVTETGDEA